MAPWLLLAADARHLPVRAGSVDLVVTSPPYADTKRYRPPVRPVAPDQYVAWFLPIAREIDRVLTEAGSFILIINERTEGGFRHGFVYELIYRLQSEVGFLRSDTYVWKKQGTPGHYFKRLKDAYELCHWFVKSPDFAFYPDAVRAPYREQTLAKSLNSPSPQRKAQRGTVRVAHSAGCYRSGRGALPSNVVTCNTGARPDPFAARHPAPFPPKLVEFFVLLGSAPGDLVYDPFCGSGTTLEVACRLGRRALGSDLTYLDLSGARMRAFSAGAPDARPHSPVSQPLFS